MKRQEAGKTVGIKINNAIIKKLYENSEWRDI